MSSIPIGHIWRSLIAPSYGEGLFVFVQFDLIKRFEHPGEVVVA
jgi:hypothetical protein